MRLSVPEFQLHPPGPASVERSVNIEFDGGHEVETFNQTLGYGLGAAVLCRLIKPHDIRLAALQEKVARIGLGGAFYRGSEVSVRLPRAEFSIEELEFLHGLAIQAKGVSVVQSGILDAPKFSALFRSGPQPASVSESLAVAGTYKWLSPAQAQANFELFNAGPGNPQVVRGFSPPS